MSTKNQIVLEGEPKGVFKEGIIDGTPKPGTCMQIKASTEPVSGRFTYEVYNRAADGNRAPVCVLLPAPEKDVDTAYVDAERCFVYYPAEGEELNMLVANIAGTGDTFAIGDQLIIDDGTGKLIATTGSPESEPFEVLETKSTALTADVLVDCLYTGH